MKAELTIAGLGCFVLALGHTLIGVRRVLPQLAEARLPGRSVGMLRFTWHVVTAMQIAFGVLLLTLAWAPHADPRTLLLRWFAGLWLAATAMAVWSARRRPRSLLRPPVALIFVVLAVMCATASV